MFYFGVVEDRCDPEQMGRVKVRVAGVHTQNQQEIPTDDLPWTLVMTPTTSPSASGVGVTPYLVEGSWVVVTFLDEYKQEGLVIGTVPGRPFEYRSGSVGFSAPSGAYPRQTDVNDLPTVSRPEDAANHPTMLARQDLTVTGIPIAARSLMPTVNSDDVGADTPTRTYMTDEDNVAEARSNDMYPLNYAEVYEGGHVVEYGNMTGDARYSYTHPTGAYQEFDGAGGVNVKSQGLHSEWAMNGRNIYVKGPLNITVQGPMNCLVDGDYTLEVTGDWHQNIHGSIRQKVGSNIESEVLQDFAQTIGKNYSQQIKQNRTVLVTAGNDRLTVGAGSQNITVQGNVLQTSNSNRTETTLGNKSEITLGNAYYFGKGHAMLESSTKTETKSAGTHVTTSASTGSYNHGGAVDITGSTIDIN